MRYRLFIVIATIIWGSSFVIVKDVTNTMAPAWILAVRFTAAAIIMAVALLSRRSLYLERSHVGFGLLFGVAMVNIYRYTGTGAGDSMLYTLADAMAALFSGAYFIAAPLIGVLGAFMSGSNTVSNTLFAPVQYETATILGISQVLIVALQCMGGAIGNMICVHNIVAVCATTGTNGEEGRLIRTNILPCLFYAVMVALIVGIFVKSGINPMPELLA